MIRITQGIDGLGQALFEVAQQSDSIQTFVMDGTNPQYVTVPTGANFVRFVSTGGADFWMKMGITSGLAIPTQNITDGSSPELNPVFESLGGATKIGLISASACKICMSFFS